MIKSKIEGKNTSPVGSATYTGPTDKIATLSFLCNPNHGDTISVNNTTFVFEGNPGQAQKLLSSRFNIITIEASVQNTVSKLFETLNSYQNSDIMKFRWELTFGDDKTPVLKATTIEATDTELSVADISSSTRGVRTYLDFYSDSTGLNQDLHNIEGSDPLGNTATYDEVLG